MTQKKESDSDSESGKLAEAETRVLPDEEIADETESNPALAETVIAQTVLDANPGVPEPGEESANSAEFVEGADKTSNRSASPAEGDDQTELVTRPPTGSDSVAEDEMAATRLIDPAAPPAVLDDRGQAEAATRVLEVSEDKTLPPPVSVESPQRPPEAPAPPPPTPIDSARGLQPGMILFGEYEIVNVLGVGGMGEVYRARHRRLDEHRAIKVMHADLSQKKGAAEFFYREAKALLAVRHPAVVHCHDLLSDDAGRVYLIMEMIEGIPLSEKMNDGPLSADDVALLGARVSHGLSAAHRKGVIHRDVSPDNIVLPHGRVQEAKLIDFGIAKILQEGEGTIIDGFKGKLSYASPEQLGFFSGKIDGRSDFYSLGLVLIAAALGRPLGMGTTVMEAVDARRGFDALPDEIPVGLRSAIAPLLKLDPEDRPKYVDRLFVVPGGLVEGATDPGRYAETGSRARATRAAVLSGSRLGLLAGIAAAALLLVGAGLYFVLGTGAESGTRTEVSNPVLAPPKAAEAEVAAVPIAATGVVATEEIAAAEPPPTEKRVEAKASPAPKPRVRKLTASERIKIIGLLNSAKLALAENQLMSPAKDNAYDRYRTVLSLDPSNQKAKDGLRSIAGRYLGMVESATGKGNRQQALTYLARAKKADSTHPDIASTEARLSP